VIRSLAQALAGELPIIAAGGITSGERAHAKIEAGAALVQIYSGLIYRGPAWSPNASPPPTGRRLKFDASPLHSAD
jgi:dihydroorotate dehydrogenase